MEKRARFMSGGSLAVRIAWVCLGQRCEETTNVGSAVVLWLAAHQNAHCIKGHAGGFGFRVHQNTPAALRVATAMATVIAALANSIRNAGGMIGPAFTITTVDVAKTS